MAEYLEKTQILSFFRPSGPILTKCYYHMIRGTANKRSW